MEQKSSATFDTRPLVISFTNNTLQTLTLVSAVETSGTKPVLDGLPLKPGGTASLSAQASGGYGAEGTLVIRSSLGQYTLKYNHPFGASASSAEWTVPEGSRVKTVTNNLNRHAAYASYQID